MKKKKKLIGALQNFCVVLCKSMKVLVTSYLEA